MSCAELGLRSFRRGFSRGLRFAPYAHLHVHSPPPLVRQASPSNGGRGRRQEDSKQARADGAYPPSRGVAARQPFDPDGLADQCLELEGVRAQPVVPAKRDRCARLLFPLAFAAEPLPNFRIRTVNVWTHLLPSIAAFVAILTGWYLLSTNEPSTLAFHPLEFLNSTFGSPIPLPSASLPSVSLADTTFFTLLYLGSAICFSLSAFYHLGLCHCADVVNVMRKADFLGTVAPPPLAAPNTEEAALTPRPSGKHRDICIGERQFSVDVLLRVLLRTQVAQRLHPHDDHLVRR